MFANLSKNQLFLLIAIVLSIVLSILSGMLFVRYTKDVREGPTALSGLCSRALNTGGFTLVTSSKGFSVSRKTTSNLEHAVYESAVSAAQCVGYEIKSYCAGPSCKVPGVTFELVLTE